MRYAVLGLALALGGCGAEAMNSPLVSAQSPPGTGQVNVASMPQPINGLPPGAANFSTAPGATQANFFSFTMGGFGGR